MSKLLNKSKIKSELKKEILIILPAYNESKVILQVINSIKKEGFNNILVIDDCSEDNTYNLLIKHNINVIKHVINRGAGAATATGLEYAKRNNFTFVVLMDSDGQHNPKDINKLLKYRNKYDIIIGSRLKGNIKSMPILRRIANFIGSILTWFFFGKFVWDSQSGFKVLNKKAINKINLLFDRYEFCSEIIGEAKTHKLKIKEVPIEVIYTSHSKSKGQSVGNGFKMLLKFIFK